MMSFILEELKKKVPYTPQGEEADYLNQLRADYEIAAEEYFKTNRWLQRKGIQEYSQKCEDASIGLWTPTTKDPWRNNITTSIIQEKLDAIVSATADLNLQAELRSFSIYGNEMEEAANGLEGLLEIANVENNSEDKVRYDVRNQLTYGTICKEVSFVTRTNRISRIRKDDFVKGEVSYTDLADIQEGRINTNVMPLDRVILGDVTQPHIWNQPYIIKDYTLKYTQAWTMFGQWANWKFVKPFTSITRKWADTAAQSEANYDIANGLVRMLVYEYKWQNKYAIVLNDVLMTDPKRPMPGQFTPPEYSVTWAPLIPISNQCAFGESLVYRMRNEALLRDFFYNALVDRTRQELEPPVVTSFRSVVNRQMYRPGTATPVGSDFKVQPLILPNNGTNSSIQMIEFIEKNLANASIAQIAQGQNAGAGPQTKFEVQQQLKNSLRVMWNVFSAVAESKRQESVLMLRLILEHYPEMGNSKIDDEISNAVGGIRKVFTTRGQVAGGEGQRNVAFASMGEKPGFDLSNMLARDEISAKEFGTARKWNLLDPDTIRKSKHTVFVMVNPSQRKSKQADQAQVMQDYVEFSTNPLIDQEWNTKQRLRASGIDPDDAMKKNAPMQPQAEAQMANVGAGQLKAGAGAQSPSTMEQSSNMSQLP